MTSSTVRLSENDGVAPAPVSYLARLIDVLEALGEEPETPRRLSEIASRTGIPLSTASRLVLLLSERRLVRRSAGGGYSLGPRLYELALRGLSCLADLDALEAAVRRLARVTGESASAGLLLGDSVVLVARRDSEHRLRMSARVGDVVDAYRSAMGKAVLAHLGPEQRLEVLAATVGPDAQGVLRVLEPELEDVRREGFARDEETYAPGLRCRAAAILGVNGVAFGAISVAGPAGRFTPDAAEAATQRLLAETTALSLAGAAA